MSSPFSMNSVSAIRVPLLYASFNHELLPPDFKPSAIIQFAVVCLNKPVHVFFVISFFLCMLPALMSLNASVSRGSCTLRTLINGVRLPTGIPSSTWCTVLLNYNFSHEISLLKSTFRAHITNQ